MANIHNSHFLLQSHSSFQRSFFHSSPTKSQVSVAGYQRHTYAAFAMNRSPYKIITASPKTRIKCFIMNDYGNEEDKVFTKIATDHSNVNYVIWRSMENVLKASFLLSLLFFHDNGGLAWAASGGRMGGRSFSSSGGSSRSTSSSSRSYSSSRSLSPSRSYLSSDNCYHSQISSPVYHTTKHEISATHELILFFIYFVGYVATKVFEEYQNEKDVVKTSVVMLQVGLLGSAKSLQADLNRIARVADTSTKNGLSYILQETTLALLRHPDFWISGYSYVDVRRSEFECENRFNIMSIEERGRFDEETLVNVNNIKKKIVVTSQGSNGICNEYIVVTIIVTARCILQLPPIRNSSQLKEALQNLASISSSNILAAEVLWTPQEENDILTEQKMHEDYPRLHPL